MFILDKTLKTDTHPVSELELCDVRLMDDATYPWLVLVPRREDMAEIIDLAPADQLQLATEIAAASHVMKALVSPDTLNVASLGNQVRQLHVHVIGRFERDPAWPKPIWGVKPPHKYDTDHLVDRIMRFSAAFEDLR